MEIDAMLLRQITIFVTGFILSPMIFAQEMTELDLVCNVISEEDYASAGLPNKRASEQVYVVVVKDGQGTLAELKGSEFLIDSEFVIDSRFVDAEYMASVGSEWVGTRYYESITDRQVSIEFDRTPTQLWSLFIDRRTGSLVAKISLELKKEGDPHWEGAGVNTRSFRGNCQNLKNSEVKF